MAGVKGHAFFDLDWRNLLRQKAEFIPQLQGDEDTSYFDARSDRYSHDFISDEEDGAGDVEQPFENFNTIAPRMSSYLDEKFRIPITDPAASRPDSGIVDVEPETNILEKPELTLLKPDPPTSESRGMDEEEEDVTGITNVDDVSSEDETEQVETVPTPSTPTSIYPEDDVPLSPLEFSHRRIGGDFSQIVLRSNSGNSIGKKTSHRVGTHFANITLSPPTPEHSQSILLQSRRNSMAVTPVIIEMDRKGYGMTLKPIRVYIGDSNNYRIHHIVQSVEKDGPAWKAGLRPNILVTHINGEAITGMQHVQIVSLMFNKERKKEQRRRRESNVITVHTIPLDQTSIRPDGRKRVPWLGRRIGKLLRKQSSRVKKKPSFFRRMRTSSHGIDSTSHSFSSSSGTPSPKLPSSPRRSESMKDRIGRQFRKVNTTPKRKQPPVSPLARSTSPVGLSSVITPNNSPPGSTQNLSSTTPPSSPPTNQKHDRHSIFTEPSFLIHKKSVSTSELFLPSNRITKHLSLIHISEPTRPY